jgi:hypothetical protein
MQLHVIQLRQLHQMGTQLFPSQLLAVVLGKSQTVLPLCALWLWAAAAQVAEVGQLNFLEMAAAAEKSLMLRLQ